MKVIKNQKSPNAEIFNLHRSEFNVNQELAYKFAERVLQNGTDLLKIEARSRLAVNDLCFTDIYHDLDTFVDENENENASPFPQLL